MPNVFLSYAREDSLKTAIIAKALSQRGWSVWWDRTIPPGKTFDDVIEEALDGAACVVVLWSKASVSSGWVRAEAAEGARRDILVPALLEAAKIPLEFRRVQAANLTSWNGDLGDQEFEQFVHAIAALIQPASAGPSGTAAPQTVEPAFDTFSRSSLPEVPERPHIRRRSYAVGAASALVVATLATGLAYWVTNREAAVSPVREEPGVRSPSGPPLSSEPRAVETSDGSAPGTIAAQRPAAGDRVGRGAAVEVVVTMASAAQPAIPPRTEPMPKGETRVTQGIEVPALTGLTIEEAETRVTRRGLSVGSVTALASDTMTADVVLSQEPAAGTRQPSGTPVALVIAEAPRVGPPAQIQVPTLIGLSERDAGETLRGARLQQGQITRSPTSASAPGIVLAQRIRAGTPVQAGTIIDLQVSETPGNTDRPGERAQ